MRIGGRRTPAEAAVVSGSRGKRGWDGRAGVGELGQQHALRVLVDVHDDEPQPDQVRSAGAPCLWNQSLSQSSYSGA